MVIARLLAVGLMSVGLSVSPGQTGGLPTSKLVFMAMHTTWPDGSPVEWGGWNYPTDIYVVDASGEHVRNLTHDAQTNYLIGRLPGSRRILDESVPSDRMRSGRSQIFSIYADGSGRRQLASGKGELLPKLSPDGRRILFARGRRPCWLYVVRSDGTHETALAQTNFGSHEASRVEPYDASWSPDGKRIAFVRSWSKPNPFVKPRSALYVINADGTGLRRLTKLRPKVQTSYPAWSPDGRRIAFNENDRTFVIRADGTDVKRLGLLGGTDWFWLSSDRLAYDEGGYGRFKTIDANGKAKPQALPDRVRVGGDLWITSGPSAGLWPVSPDGSWIALATSVPRTTATNVPLSVWIAHLDGTHRRLVSLSSATRMICCFGWSFGIDWAGK